MPHTHTHTLHRLGTVSLVSWKARLVRTGLLTARILGVDFSPQGDEHVDSEFRQPFHWPVFKKSWFLLALLCSLMMLPLILTVFVQTALTLCFLSCLCLPSLVDSFGPVQNQPVCLKRSHKWVALSFMHFLESCQIYKISCISRQ